MNFGQPQSKKRKVDVPDNHSFSQSPLLPDLSELLRSINLKVLDFDLEPICSISLATINVYCCLTCGKYYQGKSKTSFAFKHNFDNPNHKLFINLDNLKIYCLPENVEIDSNFVNNELNNIRNCINPKYSKENLDLMIDNKICFDLSNHNPYQLGILGLGVINNNTKNNFQNVILQLMAHLTKIKNWYLVNTSDESFISENFDNLSTKLAENYQLNLKFGLFLRKFWYNRLLKNHLSPFDLLNYINDISKGIFLNDSLDKNDPKFFLNWLLNNLNKGFKADNKKSNILIENIQGKILINDINENDNTTISSKLTKFWQITLNLPSKNSFIKSSNSLIDQVSFKGLLDKKFLIKTQFSENISKSYKLKSLPNYLIFNFDRFNKNYHHNFNDIVINYDPDFLDMSPYIDSNKNYEYKLIFNIVHKMINNNNDDINIEKTDQAGLFDSNKHSWKIQVLNQSTNEWFEIENLQIKKINKELLFLDESYIQVYEKIKKSKNQNHKNKLNQSH